MVVTAIAIMIAVLMMIMIAIVINSDINSSAAADDDIGSSLIVLRKIMKLIYLKYFQELAEIGAKIIVVIFNNSSQISSEPQHTMLLSNSANFLIRSIFAIRTENIPALRFTTHHPLHYFIY